MVLQLRLEQVLLLDLRLKSRLFNNFWPLRMPPNIFCFLLSIDVKAGMQILGTCLETGARSANWLLEKFGNKAESWARFFSLIYACYSLWHETHIKLLLILADSVWKARCQGDDLPECFLNAETWSSIPHSFQLVSHVSWSLASRNSQNLTLFSFPLFSGVGTGSIAVDAPSGLLNRDGTVYDFAKRRIAVHNNGECSFQIRRWCVGLGVLSQTRVCYIVTLLQ